MMLVLIVLLSIAVQYSSATSEVCGQLQNATRVWKRLQSPNYPSKFPPETVCTWRILASGKYHVKLQFTQFSLVEPEISGGCAYQWLKIVDGVGENSKEHVRCGKRSPGTLVSSGRVILLTLHSRAASNKLDYIGFEASYSITEEMPIFPVDTNTPHHSVEPGQIEEEEEEEEEEDVEDEVAPRPTLINTLGDVLDRLQPKKSSKRKTQNEIIEEINRRRNQGRDASENPYFLPDGQVLNSNGNPVRSSTQSTTTLTLENVRTNKASSSTSSEVEIVLIVLGILVAACCILFLLKKLKFIRFGSKEEGKEDVENSTPGSKATNEQLNEVLSEKREIFQFDSNHKSNKPKNHRHHHTCKKHKDGNDTKKQDEITSSSSNEVQCKLEKPQVKQPAKEKGRTNSLKYSSKRKISGAGTTQSSKRIRDVNLTRPSTRRTTKSVARKPHPRHRSKSKGGSIPNPTNRTSQNYRPNRREPRKRHSQKQYRSEETSTGTDSSGSYV